MFADAVDTGVLAQRSEETRVLLLVVVVVVVATPVLRRVQRVGDVTVEVHPEARHGSRSDVADDRLTIRWRRRRNETRLWVTSAEVGPYSRLFSQPPPTTPRHSQKYDSLRFFAILRLVNEITTPLPQKTWVLWLTQFHFTLFEHRRQLTTRLEKTVSCKVGITSNSVNYKPRINRPPKPLRQQLHDNNAFTRNKAHFSVAQLFFFFLEKDCVRRVRVKPPPPPSFCQKNDNTWLRKHAFPGGAVNTWRLFSFPRFHGHECLRPVILFYKRTPHTTAAVGKGFVLFQFSLCLTHSKKSRSYVPTSPEETVTKTKGDSATNTLREMNRPFFKKEYATFLMRKNSEKCWYIFLFFPLGLCPGKRCYNTKRNNLSVEFFFCAVCFYTHGNSKRLLCWAVGTPACYTTLYF